VVDETTAIVPATHVCFRNGHKTDIAALTDLCHARGALVLLDDYQHTGSSPLDVHQLGIDLMVTGCLKYLIAAPGVAFLYARRDLIPQLEPTITGWFGRINPFAFSIDTLDWPDHARRFESGTPPIPSVYAALAGLQLLARVGYDAIGQRIGELVSRFHAAASAAGFDVRTPAQPARRGPLVVIRSTDAPSLVAKLAGHGIIASYRGDGLRVSFHAYNNEEDVDAVLSALKQHAALVKRCEHGTSSDSRRAMNADAAP
jgi:selenocysteine lyase/cysteine desulfurase